MSAVLLWFGVEYVVRWLEALWLILVEAGGWLLAGFLVAGVIHVLVPREWLVRQLGGHGVAGVLRATALGIPIPLCSCSVIPLAAAIRRGGASKGASAAFAISSPEADAPTVSLTWGLIGPAMAIARPIGALITAISAGLFINAVQRAGKPAPAQGGPDVQADAEQASNGSPPCCCVGSARPIQPPSCCSGEDSISEPTSQTRQSRVIQALRFSLITLPGDLARWMVLGLAISALVAVAVPSGWIGQNLQAGTLGYAGAMLLMLAVGIPLYICAASSTPLAAALIAAGLSPGAALVLLLAGPATNPATIAWVWRDLGIRELVIYLATISVCAIGAGLFVDAILPNAWFRIADLATPHEHGSVISMTLGVTLCVVLAVGLISPLLTRSGTDGPAAEPVRTERRHPAHP